MRAFAAVLALVTALVVPFSGSAQQPVQQAAPPPAGDPGVVAQEPTTVQRTLSLSFDGQGNVSLVAQGVTLQEIFVEWTRLGGCYFPNADKLPRTMLVPLRFENMPELKVLDSLLRSAAGYMIAPRTTRTVGASAFEMVQILPTSTATATGAYPPINMPPPMPTSGAPDDEIPPVTPVNQGQRGAGDPAGNRPPPSVGVPASSVFVPIQPVPSGQAPPGQSTTGPGRAGQTTPPPPPPGSSGAGS
jgi:hypothetical protein